MSDAIILNREVTLDEIEQIIDNDTYALVWTEPKNIIGINYKEIRRNIRQDPHYYDPDTERTDFGWETSDILIRRYCNNNERKGLLQELSNELPKILRSASFIARKLYTFSPSFAIFICMKLVRKENIHELLTIAKAEYSTANDCEKIYLSALYLNFFDVIFCYDWYMPEDKECISIEYFNDEDKIFLLNIEKLGKKALENDNYDLQKNCSED